MSTYSEKITTPYGPIYYNITWGKGVCRDPQIVLHNIWTAPYGQPDRKKTVFKTPLKTAVQNNASPYSFAVFFSPSAHMFANTYQASNAEWHSPVKRYNI